MFIYLTHYSIHSTIQHAVYAQKSLRVQKINFKIGDSIKSGELVIELEDV